uniref:3-oxoacyl-(Acyl-carrier-protein) reductase n=1 Tax=uncultured organism TaxID=155900 RepID=M1QBP5_9ZZZZ|nr:3-oxoacyl-(acyl-carrier-protein) reductase [uncultured organism]
MREVRTIRLKDKSAIVTGGGRGIGKGIAKVFAEEGAKVLVVDLEEDLAKDTAEKIQENGQEADYVKGNVTDLADMKKVAEKCNEKYGSVDILCNNVGIYPEVSLDDMTEEDWDKVMDINLKGTFLSVKAVLPYMKEQNYGKIVITSSITGPRTAYPELVHYAASKAGVNGFIKAAGLELAKYNINVNGVEPGNILTEGYKEQMEGHIEDQAKSIPMKRMGEPEDIAHAMAFLASDEASYITGQTIIVDGGQILPETKSAIE